MPRKGYKKTTATMKRQSMAKTTRKKRQPKEAGDSRPTKRQKTNISVANHPGGSAQPHDTGSDTVFRFLDLPGEIRNQIYEVITEISERTFPHTYPNQGHERARIPPKPLPFIGLTQTCVVIRKEFRPMWLSTNRFPLYSIAGYCKAFFPCWSTLARGEASRRLALSYYNLTGTLRIWISEQYPIYTDMAPLLLFRLRFPKYNLRLVSTFPDKEPLELARIVEILVNNDNKTWMLYLKQRIISQVLVHGNATRRGTDPARIVIKERHAPDWMRKCMGHGRDNVDTYAERLGLGSISLSLGFGVDYS